ncbi:pyridoxamine 5'-phosphate oxidase [Flavobacteriales bacterium]|nr:pyridoxamine 5'-phosphate oxidase [Flavobacteriales bacterium]
MDIRRMRLNYNQSIIDFNNLEECPIEYFLDWFSDALVINENEANACVLSTISKNNLPASRVVLLKEVNKDGFTFFTNYKSNKSKDIEVNPNVALNFYWPELERQVRLVGVAKRITTKESDNYFKSRPRESQLGACVSEQSKVIDLDYSFVDSLNKLKLASKGKEVKRPLEWGGYCIVPSIVEFWQGRPSRLHDRLLYKLEGDKWSKERLAP